VQDPSQIACLSDWEEYARLDSKRRFLQRWWHALALGPFVAVLAIFHRVLYGPYHPWNHIDSVLMASLLWAGLVAVYCFTVFTRILLIKCPRCGWRFGLGTRCGSCDLPRSPKPSQGMSVA
jgi:hypothetical protein